MKLNRFVRVPPRLRRQPIEQAKTPELALALPALRRARKRAVRNHWHCSRASNALAVKEVAIATNTALIQVEDGRVVRVAPRAVRELEQPTTAKR